MSVIRTNYMNETTKTQIIILFFSTILLVKSIRFIIELTIKLHFY